LTSIFLSSGSSSTFLVEERPEQYSTPDHGRQPEVRRADEARQGDHKKSGRNGNSIKSFL